MSGEFQIDRRQLVALAGGAVAATSNACAPPASAPRNVIGNVAVHWRLVSPDGLLRIEIGARERQAPFARLYWRLWRGDTAVLAWGPLGLSVDDIEKFADVVAVQAETRNVVESYSCAHGKSARSDIDARVLRLVWQVGAETRAIELWAQNDGVALRYALTGSAHDARVTSEASVVAPAAGAKMWAQPYAGRAHLNPAAPAYETYHRRYQTDALPLDGAWFVPLLLSTPEGVFALLTEAGLGDYAGGQIKTDPEGYGLRWRLPPDDEALSEGQSHPRVGANFSTPWRAIIVGELDVIIGSRLVTDLSAPLHQAFSGAIPTWVEPGHCAWDWWNDRVTGALDEQKAYVDAASAWGWRYVLVDGKWDRALAPEPERALRELLDYAGQRGVGIWIWYNSGGANNDRRGSPRDLMSDPTRRRAELEKMARLGVRGVKVDFWHSDKQMHISRMRDLLLDAARVGLMVNLHGCTAPRGWEREFPNLMTVEAVRGGETYTFPAPYALLTGDRGPKAIDNVRMALIRNVVGAMDYTPVTFETAWRASGISYAHSLALAVAFESGIQHYADAAADAQAGYQPLFAQRPYIKEFMSSAPVRWDETRALRADPDACVVLARRSGQDWWLAGLNGTRGAWTWPLTAAALGGGAWRVRMVHDGENGQETRESRLALRPGVRHGVRMLGRGGFIAVASPIEQPTND